MTKNPDPEMVEVLAELRAALTPRAPVRSFRPRSRGRFFTANNEPSITRQEFADECDINSILRKFQITGAINHFAKYAPEYGDFTACDYQEAQNLIIRARQMFDALPSSIRALCSTPAGFLDFVNDPANSEKMAELGLHPTSPNLAKPPAADAPARPATPVPGTP